MTMSRDRRLEDQGTVLKAMISELGDAPLWDKFWDVKEPRFQQLAPTTWAELLEVGWVERRRIFGAEQYHLTEAGWIVSLELTGALDDPDFRARCIALIKYFKSVIDGRRQPMHAFISPHDLQAAGFPFGWVLNVLRSHLLERMFVGKRMNAYWEEQTKHVRVPMTFGMPID